MSEPYIGEIRLFGGTFAPVGWLACNGQLLPIGVYDALFNLIGTTYGGDGQTTFAVPDLRGRIPVHADGSGYVLGQSGGVESVTLTTSQMLQMVGVQAVWCVVWIFLALRIWSAGIRRFEAVGG